MNTEKAVERIAANNTADEIHKWEEGIAKRQDALHEAAFGILNKVCDGCPFRNNKKMGGCITSACPVNKVCDAVNALTDRTRAIARKSRNLQGKIAFEEWKKERGVA